jgi:hypothetical protein
VSEVSDDYLADADLIEERFLAEVERRAGATREEMRRLLKGRKLCEYQADDCIACWLRRILGQGDAP